MKLDYEYGATAAVNNGNVTKQTITVPGMTYPLIQNYTHDSLNRLDDANETYNGTQTWRQDFSFDRYGNRNFVESNTSFAGFDKLCNSNTELCATLRKQLNPGINSGNNNRMNSGQDYTYDSAGNTLTDANGQTFVYDGENKQVEVRNSSNAAIGKYWYDGDGKRVKKEVPGTGEVTIFVYDAGGKQIAEYSTVVASANDARVAYLTADHLGSPRINTDVTGAVTSRHDYHPFGEEMATTQRTSGLGYAADTVRKQFTGYERDSETELDFAQARYYAKQIGRFMSADVLGGNIASPQTLNRYSYVINNPSNLSDPTGYSSDWRESYDDNHKQYVLDPGNPAKRPIEGKDDILRMPRKVRDLVTERIQEFGGFSIVEPNGTVSLTFKSALITLPSEMMAGLGEAGDSFFNRGAMEASLFDAAMRAMQGLVQNLLTQSTVDSRLMALNLGIQIDSALLGVPIAEMTGLGGSAGPIGVSMGREAVGAVASYNAYLAETDALMDYQAKKFASEFANTPVGIFGRDGNNGKPTTNLSLPLTERTLKTYS
ncbi:MAG: hypothetical protein IPN51_12925 [Chloracidobacterium sp.]|nr:hypothetical protein [Chloracidobacterium sp.]